MHWSQIILLEYNNNNNNNNNNNDNNKNKNNNNNNNSWDFFVGWLCALNLGA